MTEPALADAPSPMSALALKLRGVNHLALVTDDMKVTIDFYTAVLDIRLVHAMKVREGLGTGAGNRGNPPFERIRHYFFDMGNDELLAFFEIPRGARGPADRDAIGGMQHVSFTASAELFEAIRRRLEERKIDYLGPIDILGGRAQSIYFMDPNNIRLEVTRHGAPGRERYVIEDLSQSKAVALAELRTLCPEPGWAEKIVEHLPD